MRLAVGIVVVGVPKEVKATGSSFAQMICPFPMVLVPVIEFTRMVMLKELKQGDEVEEVACTRTVEVSDNVPEGTNRVVATDEGPWLIPLMKYS